MPLTHRIESQVAGTPVNAYLVEGEHRLVAIDGTLTVSGARAVRDRIDAIGKPLAALLVTHAHPDHYGGAVEVVAGSEAPIVATAGVDAAIRRDDEGKEAILRPMFGDEWPTQRAFPNRLVEPGAELAFGGIELVVRDGHWERWLTNLDTLAAELPDGVTLLPGHGEQAGRELLDWQRGYIHRFVAAVRAGDWDDPQPAKQSVVAAMSAFLPADDLRFLMELSIEPVAAKLGLLEPSDS